MESRQLPFLLLLQTIASIPLCPPPNYYPPSPPILLPQPRTSREPRGGRFSPLPGVGRRRRRFAGRRRHQPHAAPARQEARGQGSAAVLRRSVRRHRKLRGVRGHLSHEPVAGDGILHRLRPGRGRRRRVSRGHAVRRRGRHQRLEDERAVETVSSAILIGPNSAQLWL